MIDVRKANRIRPFADADLAAVYDVQLRCPQAAQWPAEDILHCAHDAGGTVLVAELEAANLPQVAGFAVFHRVIDEAELRNLAVDPAHRRKGVARALLAAGIRLLQGLRVQQMFLEVRASNQPALAFYTSLGFRLLYTRRDYYQAPREDAVVMALNLSPLTDFPCPQEL
jgi:ribosomal-protein-alanine N-acetyltransferase